MARTTAGLFLLAILLLASNLWWAFKLVDAGVMQTYLGYVSVGRIGLKFHPDGRLQDVVRGWDPPQ